jgi:inositol oxygenase
MFSSLDRAQMDVWQALDKLDELREYEAALFSQNRGLDPDMSLKDHALQTAELCRLSHPDKDWLHLVGLLHGLGKLLAHKMFDSQPQWAICGESFPLGCRFDSSIEGAQFFTANPDRRRRLYTTPLGIYQPECGLQHVYMSWSAAEYLYLLLLLNNTSLPNEALFIIRYQKFYSLTKPNSQAYHHLLSKEDKKLLPLLSSFQSLSSYVRLPLLEGAMSPGAQQSYYNSLLDKYLGQSKLSW